MVEECLLELVPFAGKNTLDSNWVDYFIAVDEIKPCEYLLEQRLLYDESDVPHKPIKVVQSNVPFVIAPILLQSNSQR